MKATNLIFPLICIETLCFVRRQRSKRQNENHECDRLCKTTSKGIVIYFFLTHPLINLKLILIQQTLCEGLMEGDISGGTKSVEKVFASTENEAYDGWIYNAGR